MSDTSVLQRMLQPSILISLENHYENKKVILIENQAPDSFIEIHKIPADALVIDLDKAFNNQGLFQGKSGECKRADYVIISEQEKRVLFIEMKRSNAPAIDIINQLKGALCAFEYCQIIGREFFQERDFLAQYQKRFISVRHTGGTKQRTEIEQTAPMGERHNTPDHPLRISWAKCIQFRKIAS
jgi:hypothetical protein